ncbi:MAG TPA: hypothetical protein DCL34_04660 [Erythrobacter sp.]|jgi:uncharacterized repeat protein (TIGR01451 family)|nr:hypothetical protein IT881_09350 [Erythrobacter sp. A30-3]HAG36084.1 hypothetical protein [Erythrobacter sp.]|tara:strand:- start:3387 stop:4361 length:975 start_codon:yes stop_codon:yes gene_type:complete
MTKAPFRLALAPLAIAAALITTPAHAGGVKAGTLIENTASATYDGGAGPVTIPSNTITVKVDELLDVTVTSRDSGPVSAAPGSAVLTFELTNTGNGPEAYTLSANPAVAGNDFDTTVNGIAVDTNSNGVYDPGVDQMLTGPATTAAIAADASLTVFVLVTIPGGVADGDQSDVSLLAEAVTGTGAPGTAFAGQGAGGGNAIVGSTGANATATGSLSVGITDVDLIKSATVRDPFGGTGIVPGATITYAIRAEVRGSGSVSDLVVTDAAPADTTYVAGSLKLDGATLTDAADADAGRFGTSGISVDLGTVSGGSSRTVTFQVTID